MCALGQGTWEMGEDPSRRSDEIDSLRRGLDLGLTVIDTAEMYGDGTAETLVGKAITGRRDEVFLVSKVYPYHASRSGVVQACEHSLRRLQTDRLDLYLLHWPSSHPIEETIEGFEALTADGRILRWGVSNFDLSALQHAVGASGGAGCATNQVLYNLQHRGIEIRPAAVDDRTRYAAHGLQPDRPGHSCRGVHPYGHRREALCDTGPDRPRLRPCPRQRLGHPEGILTAPPQSQRGSARPAPGRRGPARDRPGLLTAALADPTGDLLGVPMIEQILSRHGLWVRGGSCSLCITNRSRGRAPGPAYGRFGRLGGRCVRPRIHRCPGRTGRPPWHRTMTVSW